MIDWFEILKRFGVDYIDSGSKTTRGHVNVRCPWCAEDNGHHLGLSLKTGRFYCWRDSRHCGSDSAFALAHVAVISYEQAVAEIGKVGVSPGETIAELSERFSGLLRKKHSRVYEDLEWAKEMFLPTQQHGAGFLKYLSRRGIEGGSLVFADYNMRVAISGRFAYRILFPAYTKSMRQIGWTGRTVSHDCKARYLSHPDGRALGSAVFCHRVITSISGGVLVLCEGPFDALALDQVGRRYGVRAVAVFGVSMGLAQLGVLMELADSFDRLFILFDRGAMGSAERLRASLSAFSPKILRLPSFVDDPGELSHEKIIKLCRELVVQR